MERRLAAIFIADVVGYSRLSHRDEEGTRARFLAHLKEIFEPKIIERRGRLVKTMGDGLLVEFPSIVNALRCAIEVQHIEARKNADLPEEQQLRFRIGINLGDVIAEGDDVHGDGVNTADRLQGLAEPGGIVISGSAYDQVKNKLAIGFDSLGEQRIKNIDEPVRAYRVRPADAGADAAPGLWTKDTLPLPDKPSVAVLPFANMSGDADQDYFADGMVEEIITALSRMHWLFVIARNSTFVYKGRSVDVKQIGRELGVRYVLEGSVRKAGNKLRITGQLIDSTTSAHLWADRFDGSVEDVFDLQDRVTASVVAAIAPKLEQAEIERSRRKPTESLDAYDFYLRGLAALHLWTKVSSEEALVHFYRAIELDPRFASAYGMAARCYSVRKVGGWLEDPAKDIVEVDRLARKAAELGRDNAVALATAGIALSFVAGDLERGREFVDRATALDPNMAWAWLFSGWTRVFLGEPEAANEHIARAIRLSPLDPHRSSMFGAMASTYFYVGRYDEALVWAERSARAVRADGGFLYIKAMMAASAALAGNAARAREALDVLRREYPDFSISSLAKPGSAFPFRRVQDLERLANGLRKAGVPE